MKSGAQKLASKLGPLQVSLPLLALYAQAYHTSGRVLSLPSFPCTPPSLHRFPHLFTNKEPTAEELEVAAAEAEIEPATPILDAVAEELAEEPAVQVEAPEPAVEKVPEPKEVTKPKARATSKKTTTKAKAATPSIVLLHLRSLHSMAGRR